MKRFLLLLLLCCLTACGSASSSGDESTTDSDSSTEESSTPSTGLPNCDDYAFDTLPVDPLLHIIALGNTNANGGHVFPTVHSYVYFLDHGTNPVPTHSVFAPGDITITSITKKTYTENNSSTFDYSIMFDVCKTGSAYFYHIKDVPSTINALLSSGTPSCSNYSTGGQDIEDCNYTLNHKASSGEVIGFVGGTNQTQTNFDFGYLDSTLTLGFLDPNYYWADYYKMSCAWDRYDSSLTATIQSKLGGFIEGDFSVRTSTPICGSAMQDVSGTAQGNWLNPAETSFETEDAHIALYTHNATPSLNVIAIGSDSGVMDNNKAYDSHFLPLSSGVISRAFIDITPSDTIYCYSSTDVGIPDNIISGDSQNSKELRVLIQLPDQDTLYIKADYDVTSCSSIPVSLSDYKTFKRDI